MKIYRSLLLIILIMFTSSAMALDVLPDPVCSGTVFKDVNKTNPMCGYIEMLKQFEITSGCGDGKYCPDATVTRGQMAVFIIKAIDEALSYKNIIPPVPPVPPTPPPSDSYFLQEPYPVTVDNSIGVNEIAKYYFKLKKDISTAVMVYLSTRDWSTDQDIVLSNKTQPTSIICDRNAGYYCGTTPGTNNEKVIMSPISGKTGDMFYVTVFNKSETPGNYRIYWTAY